jgi:hypothetical protein
MKFPNGFKSLSSPESFSPEFPPAANQAKTSLSPLQRVDAGFFVPGKFRSFFGDRPTAEACEKSVDNRPISLTRPKDGFLFQAVDASRQSPAL